MSFTIYSALIPMAKHLLANQSKILSKAEEYAKEQQIDPSALLESRFAPDMLPYVRQIQLAADTVKKAAARLAAVEAPVFEDNESTIAELQERIAKTITFLDSVPESAFEGAETRELKIPLGPGLIVDMTGQNYLTQWVLPNFIFHATTAYDLLRHQGIALGKRDFLG